MNIFIADSVHFYNYNSDAWNPNIFPKARFISEYGFQSIPSVHSLQQTMYSTDKIGDLIGHRQHFPFGSLPITTAILRNFKLPPNSNGNYWDAYIYFSQINQAMSTKVETETYRLARNDWLIIMRQKVLILFFYFSFSFFSFFGATELDDFSSGKQWAHCIGNWTMFGQHRHGQALSTMETSKYYNIGPKNSLHLLMS